MARAGLTPALVTEAGAALVDEVGFDELSMSLLADRLASLSERQILHQVKIEGRSDWAEYKLTPKGLDFFPVIGVTLEWGEHWYVAEEGPVLKWRHRTCRKAFTGVLKCDQCDEPLAASDLRL